MPTFVTSDNGKDLVSLLDTGLLGVASGLGRGLTRTTKQFPFSERPTVSNYSSSIMLSVWS